MKIFKKTFLFSFILFLGLSLCSCTTANVDDLIFELSEDGTSYVVSNFAGKKGSDDKYDYVELYVGFYAGGKDKKLNLNGDEYY